MDKQIKKEYRIGDGNFLAEISLAEGKDGVFEVPEEIQLARTGQFFRLWNDGEIWKEISLTEEMFDSFIKNFNDKVTGLDLAIDFSHFNNEKAGAWIKTLSKVPSKDFPGQFELKCKPRWTKSGIDSIGGGDYRYLSIEINVNWRNNNTLVFHGPTLLGGGFTNRPVIKNMNPTSKLSEEILNKEKEAMETKELQEKNATLSEELKTSNESLSEVKEENKTLKEENEKLLSDKANAEKNSAFDKKLSEGTVCEAQREHYLSGDMDKFMSTSQKPLNLSEKGSGEAPSGDEGMDDDDKIIEAAEKLCEKNEGMTISEAILEVKKNK